MNNVFIVLCIALFSGQTIFLKNVQTKTKSSLLFVNMILAGIATAEMAVFGLFNKDVFLISQTTVIFSLIFGTLFALTILFYNIALGSGPLSYTAFYFSSSMIIPTLYGLIFANESVTPQIVAALILFIAAFYFINVKSRSEQTKNKPNQKKWIIFCILTFIGNGSLAVTQGNHQRAMQGQEAYGFMFLSFAVAVVVCALLSLIFYIKEKKTAKISENRDNDKSSLKNNIVPAALAATCSLAGNLLSTILAGRIPSSILFPLMQGGIVVTITLLSIFLYKDRISIRGKIGIALGTLAIVIINL